MVKQKPVINILFLHKTLHDGYSFESSQRADCNETQYVWFGATINDLSHVFVLPFSVPAVKGLNDIS